MRDTDRETRRLLISLRWVYVGELGPGGGLDWKGSPGGNIPQSGMLPDIFDTSLYLLVRSLAAKGEYEGRDVDWDASAIKVNGMTMRTVLESAYGKQALSAAAADSVLRTYLDFASRLGKRHVALVAVAF